MDLSRLCHTEESFERLSSANKAMIGDLAKSINMAGFETPFESKHHLWKTMANHSIMVPGELFENLEMDDSIEMWSEDLGFLFAMGRILQYYSYSVKQLTEAPWEELFERDEAMKQQILSRYVAALTTGETQYNVADWHLVKETKSLFKASGMIRIKQITPFTSRIGNRGVFAIIKVKRPPGLILNLSQFAKALIYKIQSSFEN